MLLYRCYWTQMRITATDTSHPPRPQDGWARRSSRLWRRPGWAHQGWYNPSGHFLPTPAWRKNIDALGTKCPWAAIKNCALATRGWNLHRPVWLCANRGIQVSAATLWPLLRRRTPAAEHCGTYKKLKQDTQFCMLDLDVQTFLAPVAR